MNERLRSLRSILDKSQREISKELGLPQPTYATLESGTREIKESHINLICKTYNVNEEWFRDGIGDMFIKEYDNDLKELISIYEELTPQLKKYLLRNIKELKDIQDNRQ